MSDLVRQFEFNVAAVNEPHIACVLLLDTSGSMAGAAIESLNIGLKAFKEQSMLDDLARKRIDVAIVTFNDAVQTIQNFCPLPEMTTPALEASGQTAMGAGLNYAMDLIDKRKALYKEVGTPYFRPWIFMITDGEPTDEYQTAAARLAELEEKRRVMCWAVGVPGYNPAKLKHITDRVIELSDVNFASMFEWLSNSMVAVSHSNIGDKVKYDALPENARVIPDNWTN
jgi:uncharacterized protein YegL